MKTPAELKALRDNWRFDPCWDIEDTEGFEEYKEELRLYRIEQERLWAERRFTALVDTANRMGIPDNLKLASYIERLEKGVKSLEERLYSLENISDAEKSRRRM